MREIYENIHDVIIISKVKKYLYKHSKESLISALFLVVNLKVMNGISNTTMAQLLNYAIFIYLLLQFLVFIVVVYKPIIMIFPLVLVFRLLGDTLITPSNTSPYT